ncbi:hypothetical protein VCRA2123E76_40049 [Vibrio crassostreae]|nr:hypothetical protein VCRA2123E76_40049 [Vibrio crassostreae]
MSIHDELNELKKLCDKCNDVKLAGVMLSAMLCENPIKIFVSNFKEEDIVTLYNSLVYHDFSRIRQRVEVKGCLSQFQKCILTDRDFSVIEPYIKII